MLASQVPDGLIVAAFVLASTLVVGFAGWIAREMYRISELNGRTAERLDEIERRGDAYDARIRAIENLYLPEHERRR